MDLSRNEVAKMIRQQIARTLLRATDTLKPEGALAAEVVLDPVGGLTKSIAGLATAADTALKTGDLIPRGNPGPHSGWLLCDGSAVSRTTYSALFANIGTTYGAGNGSTTFNLPDARGVAIIGVS